MMKEAMSSNPMLQSVYGSLESPTQPNPTPITDASSPSSLLKNKQSYLLGGRKRNTSLTQQSPDLQTKRMLSYHDNPMLLQLGTRTGSKLTDDHEDVLIESTSTDKTLLKEKCLNDVSTMSALIKESISEEKLGLLTNQPLYIDDEKENRESNWSSSKHDQDDDENLINLIDSNINMGIYFGF